jgi:hypothetical protein
MADHDLIDEMVRGSGIQERKRAELQAALDAGLVSDPVTFTVLGSHFLGQLVIGAGISAAVSLGTPLLLRALLAREGGATCR